MTRTSFSSRSDKAILSISKTILSEQGFQVESMNDDIELIIAENNNFLVVVAALNTISNLILAEPVAIEAFSKRIASVTLGSKKWDTYLVMLTQEKSAEDDGITRDLYAINHDTSRIRRIAHTGVEPTTESVRNSLSLFIEPVTTASTVLHTDALKELLNTLITDGVDEQLAQRAIAAFEQGASLDDVL